MEVRDFVNILGADFYSGVPDSQLKALCNYLMDRYGTNPAHHVIAANEGNCVALGAGYYLSTGKIPVTYMQNSGEGNVINPVASLLNDNVYGIPMIFVVGWRGEPGVHDEPQHVYQGMVTVRLLNDMDIECFIVDKDTSTDELKRVMEGFRKNLNSGKQVAFIIKKGALSTDVQVEYKNDNIMLREEIIEHITRFSGDDPIVSTTGKASRELFEIRERKNDGHRRDFLTVGSMGHSLSIALGIAINKPGVKVWCIDGDGACLMHMGSLAVTGNIAPSNLVHIVINNGAHETVGGMPTVAGTMDLCAVATGCGYRNAVSVGDIDSLDRALSNAAESDALTFIEIKCAIGAREDLGRPTTSAAENKKNFMDNLRKY